MSLPHATIPTNLRRRAVRRSCDRCHTQKLKCTGNNANVVRAQCQRCQQAGLKCVYSERLPKRSLQNGGAPGTTEATRTSRATATTTPFASSSSAITPPPLLSPRTQIGNSAIEETLSSPSAAALQFSGTSVDFDHFGSFPSCWPPSSIICDDANSNDCLGMLDFDCEFEGPLNSAAPVSPPLFEFQGEKDSSSGQADTTSTQGDLFESLSDVSQDLEAILHGVTVDWPKQEIWNYPIGNFLNTFSRLLAHLKEKSHTSSNSSMLDECLQTKTLFMAVHCYMLSVNIMASLSQLLLSQILNAQACGQKQAKPIESYRSGSTSQSNSGSAETLPSFHSNLHIGELFSHVNPFMHALSSACATLRVSLQLLSEIETALGIAQEYGATASTRLASKRSDIPSISWQRLAGEDYTITPASRLITVLWSDEAGDEDPKSRRAPGKTLAVLRRCCKETFALAKNHNMAL